MLVSRYCTSIHCLCEVRMRIIHLYGRDYLGLPHKHKCQHLYNSSGMIRVMSKYRRLWFPNQHFGISVCKLIFVLSPKSLPVFTLAQYCCVRPCAWLVIVKKRAARTRHFGLRVCEDAIENEVVVKRTKGRKRKIYTACM